MNEETPVTPKQRPEENTGQGEASSRTELPKVRTLFKEAWQRYTAQWKLFVGIGAVGTIVAIIVMVLSGINVGFLLFPLLFPAFIYTAKHDDTAITFGTAWRTSFALFLPFLWVVVLGVMIVNAGLALLIIPGIILYTWFAVDLYALFDSNVRGFDALLTSKEYVRGYWGPVFWRTLAVLLFILLSLLALVLIGLILFSIVHAFVSPSGAMMLNIALPITFIVVSIAVQWMFVVPLIATYLYSLYKNLVEIKGDVARTFSTREKAPYIALAVLGVLLTIGFATWLNMAAPPALPGA